MDGIDLMAGAMRAAKTRLDVSSDNLANLSTDGFRRSIARTMLDSHGVSATVDLDRSSGPLRRTGREFDLSVAGAGSFFVCDSSGALQGVRSVSLVRSVTGELHDDQGRRVMGEHGLLRVGPDATFDQDGTVRENGEEIGRLRLSPGTSVQSGFLETANVNAVREMVDVLSAQRSFETAEQTLAAIDGARSKAVNDVVRVKA